MAHTVTHPITIENAEKSYAEFSAYARDTGSETVVFDLAGLEEIDSAGLAVFHRLQSTLEHDNRRLEFENIPERVRQLFELSHFDEPSDEIETPPPPKNELERIGLIALDTWQDMRSMLGYIGRVTLALIWSFKYPKKVRWGDVVRYVQETGANALPIVGLMSALVGLVIAFSSAIQLKQFGANIFIADLIGIGVSREIGPLMAAILLIARSGSAFAAEIGTQKISEEIDALTVMGLKPVPYLVIPRIIATLITLPLLTIFADFFGVAGGMVIAQFSLDVSPTIFVTRLGEAVSLWDISSGVMKSFFFAILIAGVGCYRGMETSGGAMGVGRSTTQSVVSGIFLLVIADSIFVVLFQYLGLN
ncbi:MlaE family lipid ABC transporter permease subunit [bacterium]|nr:MlaE family lipid ABC transporter permease subunit [bacterium]